MDELQEILASMDIPEQRKTDMGWLWRNIGIRNSEHSQLSRARDLIRMAFAKGGS